MLEVDIKRNHVDIEEFLIEELNFLQDQVKDIVGQVEIRGDDADLGSSVFSQDIKITLNERATKRIKEIRITLGRIKQNDFGFCEKCEEQIEPKRLIHIPTATLCIKCQQEKEIIKKRFN